MLIILHSPQFTHEDRVDYTLSGHHTVSLKCSAGVITLDRNDCRRILPAIQHLAEHGASLADATDE